MESPSWESRSTETSASESDSENTSPATKSPASDLWKAVEDNANAAMKAAEALKVRAVRTCISLPL